MTFVWIFIKLNRRMEKSLTEQIKDHICDLVCLENRVHSELYQLGPITVNTINDVERERAIYSSFFMRIYKVHRVIKDVFRSSETVETKDFSMGILLRPLLLDAMIIVHLENLDPVTYRQALNGLALDAPDFWGKFLKRFSPISTESWVENEKASLDLLRQQFSGGLSGRKFTAINLFDNSQQLPTDFKKLTNQSYSLYERYSKYDHFSIILELNKESEQTKWENIQAGLCCTTTSLGLVCRKLKLKNLPDETFEKYFNQKGE